MAVYVFLAYAESEIEFIFLLLTMLQKTKATGDERKPMLAYIQEYGSQLGFFAGMVDPRAGRTEVVKARGV